MTIDISKACSDLLRQSYAPEKLKASHARELIAAFFGYKSHAALLAEKEWPLSHLEDAMIMVPDLNLLDKRRTQLDGLPQSDLSSKDIAEVLSTFLKEQQLFHGESWIYDSLETYVMEQYLIENTLIIDDGLSGIMAETNACFDEMCYETANISEEDGIVTITVEGQYNGSNDPDKPFSGDQIDMTVKVTFPRVAGRIGFSDPEIEVGGSLNDDWVDPELRFGLPAE